MLKYIIYIVVFIVLATLFISGFHLTRVHFRNKKEMAQYANSKIAFSGNLGKVLVVYYSLSGNTRDIAQKIQAQTNADMYEIKTKEPLPTTPSLYLTVRNQNKTGAYPAVGDDLPDFAAYNLIFVGAPVWNYTSATPVLAFLDKADFKGKKVAPFTTQGSNPGTFTADFKAKAKNAIILEDRKFNNLPDTYDSAVENKLTVWLNTLSTPI